MRNGLVQAAVLLVAGLLFSSAPQARGDATVYWDSENGFSPRTAVIAPGDMVTWWNIDPYGFDMTATFNSSFSFLLENLQGQSVIFPTQAGTYSYHNEWGDNGAVIVNVAPTVTILTPADNAILPAPATFTIQAAVTETPDDSVSDVEFFLGTSETTNSVEDVFSTPYSTSMTNLDAGTYTLIAVARDSHGWTSTNSITITVSGGGPINLTAPRISTGQFLFDVTGLTVGKTHVVQTSTNLISWTAIQTNVATAATLTFTNTTALSRRFFRLAELP